MKKFNLSIVIPAYRRYENVFKLLTYFQKQELQFNNIYLVIDKIVKFDNAQDVVDIYHHRNLVINEFKNVRVITHEKDKGKPGMAEIINMVDETDDDNIVFLEDDLMVNEQFFEQCETFFRWFYSSSSPIFIGYSNTYQTLDTFFETYCSIPQWGLVTKMKDLKELTNFYFSVQNKQEIIDEVLNKTFPDEVFEKYKKQIVDANSHYFLTRPNSIDVYFMFYLLKMGKKVWKNCKCHVALDVPKYEDKNHNPIERDILNALYLWRILGS